MKMKIDEDEDDEHKEEKKEDLRDDDICEFDNADPEHAVLDDDDDEIQSILDRFKNYAMCCLCFLALPCLFLCFLTSTKLLCVFQVIFMLNNGIDRADKNPFDPITRICPTRKKSGTITKFSSESKIQTIGHVRI